jgi:Transglycosylase-like domain
MRNLFHRSSLLVAALLLATMLLVSDFSAEPAGAMGLSRRAVTLSGRSMIRRGNRVRVSRSFRRVRASALPIGDIWARLRQCESGGRYAINTGNGFFGAYQFHPRTWRTLGYPGLPHQASPEMQDEAARRLQARSGWGQWPVCSRRIGAR